MNAPFGEDYESDPADRFECSECARPLSSRFPGTCADCDAPDAIDTTDQEAEIGL